jgi:hypothetical protein
MLDDNVPIVVFAVSHFELVGAVELVLFKAFAIVQSLDVEFPEVFAVILEVAGSHGVIDGVAPDTVIIVAFEVDHFALECVVDLLEDLHFGFDLAFGALEGASSSLEVLSDQVDRHIELFQARLTLLVCVLQGDQLVFQVLQVVLLFNQVLLEQHVLALDLLSECSVPETGSDHVLLALRDNRVYVLFDFLQRTDHILLMHDDQGTFFS